MRRERPVLDACPLFKLQRFDAMSNKTHISEAPFEPKRHAAVAALHARMRGAGGLYNIGNLIGLLSGITFALLQDTAGQNGGAFDSLMAYLAGNPGNAALTISMLLFIWSGENYHIASMAEAPKADHSLRKADLLAGLAAVFLSVSLASSGTMLLAVTSTVLLAGGKLGNAAFPRKGWPIEIENWAPWSSKPLALKTDVFRCAVIVSRVPAIAALVLAIADGLAAPILDTRLLEPAILLLCYLLWTKADLVLMRQ